MAKVIKKAKEVATKKVVAPEIVEAPKADLGNSPCTACDRGFNRITREVCSVCHGTPEN